MHHKVLLKIILLKQLHYIHYARIISEVIGTLKHKECIVQAVYGNRNKNEAFDSKVQVTGLLGYFDFSHTYLLAYTWLYLREYF